ncbi:hypothetical protein PSQ90_15345 [Devosia rhodophyticola]|uniref:Uncharacterized protein n=1 Tax=Devosia rhodophyticola TaxID=3026423 RepID=A0ABY7YWD2_9HYPH|nr:hypothetical protein [Devosia rhodophyticola]WDR05621.1 hypothetical protein PSQ90_15345 [Devosia rhodophyticola]
MRDHASNIALASAIAPAVQTATVTGAAIDVQEANGVTVIVHTGAIAGSGDFTAKLQESATTADEDFTDVEHLIGSFPDSLEASATIKVGYVGYKRYVRAVLTKNSGTSIAASALVELSALRARPAV